MNENEFFSDRLNIANTIQQGTSSSIFTVSATPDNQSITIEYQGENRLCPYRKKYFGMREDGHVIFQVPYFNDCEYIEEEFLPCLKEQCMAWNSAIRSCCR